MWSLADLPVLVLAAFRMAVLIIDDEGPLSLFAKIRGKIDPMQKTWVGRGLRCYWCVGFWAAWLCVGLHLMGDWGDIILWGFAVAAGVMLVVRGVRI